jgi:O-antigen/teichoic acid export membrane protein
MSSYLFLGVNVLCTLVSIPLMLHYLSTPEFGLWLLIQQIANYLSLIDLGMGSSVARILIDHKDDRANGRYGATIKCGLWVGAVQGGLVLLAGLAFIWFAAALLRIPAELHSLFFWLLAGQWLFTGLTFVGRIFGQVLFAWQRMDIWNYVQIAQQLVGLGMLWLIFKLDWGAFGLLVPVAVSWMVGITLGATACFKLGFWPKAGEWGRASRQQFRELFNYGADIFLIALGTQLIMSSQTMLISRQLGVEAVALWGVMTKAFSLVGQMVWRFVGSAMPAFAEMHVRHEGERLWRRYRTLFIATNAIAGVCGVLFAACNGPFVEVWTHGKFFWSATDNILLGIWLVLLTQQCCNNSLIMTFKEIRGLKYIYFLEGIVFVIAGLFLLPRYGLTGMLVCSNLATFFFTWIVGAGRVSRLGGLGWKTFLWDWQWPLFQVLVVLVPCWLAAEWLLRNQSAGLRFLIMGGGLALVGGWALLRLALPTDVVSELAGKFPASIRRLFRLR